VEVCAPEVVQSLFGRNKPWPTVVEASASVLEQFRSAEERVAERLRELKPLVEEYLAPEQVAQRLGLNVNEDLTAPEKQRSGSPGSTPRRQGARRLGRGRRGLRASGAAAPRRRRGPAPRRRRDVHARRSAPATTAGPARTAARDDSRMSCDWSVSAPVSPSARSPSSSGSTPPVCTGRCTSWSKTARSPSRVPRFSPPAGEVI
jgi:hypothetical protein